MTDLITRIEQADGPSAPLFIAAWNVLQSSDTASADWDRYAGIRVTVDEVDVHRWIAFRKCLDAEAWTSAAEMLAPTCDDICVMTGDGPWVGPYARIWTCDPAREAPFDIQTNARHPSLALLAAILRAGGTHAE